MFVAGRRLSHYITGFCKITAASQILSSDLRSTVAYSSAAAVHNLHQVDIQGFVRFLSANMTTATPEAPCNGTTNTSQGSNGLNLVAEEKKYKVVFVLGGPGSGKGTQSERLVEDFNMAHLSAGDLLRAHMKSGTPEGQMVANMIANGQIVPSHVTISLLQRAMDASGKLNVLIDGFPRNEENRSAFEKQTGIEPEFVLFFDCPEEIMEKRILGRNQGRTDDNIETIRKRFRVFIEQSMPIIQHYEKFGKVRQINADRSPDDIYNEVSQLFENF